MKFKVGDWIEVNVGCLNKWIKEWYGLPKLPSYIGKVKKIMKAKRPYGVEFYGFVNENKTDYNNGMFDEPFNHHGLF